MNGNQISNFHNKFQILEFRSFLEEKSRLVKYWKSSLNFHFEFPLDLAGYGSEVAGEGHDCSDSADLCLCQKY